VVAAPFCAPLPPHDAITIIANIANNM